MRQRRRYPTLEIGRRVQAWREILTPRPWWRRTLDFLDRVFWP